LIDNPPGGGDVVGELEAAQAAAAAVDGALTSVLDLLSGLRG